MKRSPLLSAVLALSLAMGTPAALAHVGHGDEFQAEGGVNRVEVNAETDPLLGIQVSPIEPAADGSGAVLIPVTALVEDNGQQLVFVQYENFYEPVPVTTGSTQGDLVEVVEGVSVGEQLVTQGSLSLYAESRKTQTADAAAEAADPAVSAAPASAAPTETPIASAPEPAATEGEANETAAAPAEATEASGGLPMGLIAGIGAGAALIAGAVVVLGRGQKGGL